MKEKRSLHYLIALAGILIGVCLDQFTKYLAVLHLKGQAPLVLIDGVFQLEYLENRGAAFGLFQGQRLFFFLSAGVILAIGRIVGETAALMYTSGTVAQIPDSIMGSGRTLALHMYVLSSEGLYMDQAYATAVILLVLVVGINALSSFIARKLTKA